MLMIFKASRNHIEWSTESGFMLFYLWWGVDPFENVRTIDFIIGRPAKSLSFHIILWKVK